MLVHSFTLISELSIRQILKKIENDINDDVISWRIGFMGSPGASRLFSGTISETGFNIRRNRMFSKNIQLADVNAELESSNEGTRIKLNFKPAFQLKYTLALLIIAGITGICSAVFNWFGNLLLPVLITIPALLLFYRIQCNALLKDIKVIASASEIGTDVNSTENI